MPILTPYLAVSDARAALDFYAAVFGGAARGEVIVLPDGRVGHAEMEIGDALLMLAEESDDIGHLVADPGGAAIHLRVPDVEETVTRAEARGARTIVAPADRGHGPSARIRDPFGQDWIIARTPAEDGADLYRRWLAELWNGRLDQLAETAATLVTEDFAGHWPGRPDLVTGPAELAEVVRQGRQSIEGCVFERVAGPVVDGDLVGGRWVGKGRYQGEPVVFHGHDLLRIDGGAFAEYWVISEDPTT